MLNRGQKFADARRAQSLNDEPYYGSTPALRRKQLAIIVSHAVLAVAAAELALENHEEERNQVNRRITDSDGLSNGATGVTSWHELHRTHLEIELDRARIDVREAELAVARHDHETSQTGQKEFARPKGVLMGAGVPIGGGEAADPAQIADPGGQCGAEV